MCLQKKLTGKIKTDLLRLQRKKLHNRKTEQGLTEGPRHQQFGTEIVAVTGDQSPVDLAEAMVSCQVSVMA